MTAHVRTTHTMWSIARHRVKTASNTGLQHLPGYIIYHPPECIIHWNAWSIIHSNASYRVTTQHVAADTLAEPPEEQIGTVTDACSQPNCKHGGECAVDGKGEMYYQMERRTCNWGDWIAWEDTWCRCVKFEIVQVWDLHWDLHSQHPWSCCTD